MLGLLLVIFAAVWFVRAVDQRAFAQTGLGATIYWLHDVVYLPLKGHTWVRLFPYVFLWLVPLVVFSILLILEFATGFGLVRGIHRWVILELSKRSNGLQVLGTPLARASIDEAAWAENSDSARKVIKKWTGFALRVVTRAQTAIWYETAADAANGRAPTREQVQELLNLTEVRSRLGASDPYSHLRSIEVLMLLRNRPESLDLRMQLMAFYKRHSEMDLIAPFLDVLQFLDEATSQTPLVGIVRMHRVTELLAGLKSDAPLEFACLAVQGFGTAWAHGLLEGRIFQKTWVSARLSQGEDTQSDVMGRAEGMIYFELWSKLAEVALSGHPTDVLLGKIVSKQSVVKLIDQGEMAAWEGRAG